MSIITGNEFDGLKSRMSISTPFESEARLINVVLNQITQFTEGNNIVKSTELPIGAGIVDVVAGHRISQIDSSKYESLTDLEAYLLSRLYFKQRLTLQSIIHRAQLPAKIVGKTLEQLVHKRYSTVSGNCYLRGETNIQNLIAIEGKTKNWKRALTQANRNRLFTSQTFVALDARYARPALQNIDLFMEAKVGLAVVFWDGDISIAYKPPKADPIAPIMPILAESALLERIS